MDDHGVAVLHHQCRFRSNRVLGDDGDVAALGIGAREHAVGRRAIDRRNAAIDLSRQPLLIELVDIAANGGDRDIQPQREVPRRRERKIAQMFENLPLSIEIAQFTLPVRPA